MINNPEMYPPKTNMAMDGNGKSPCLTGDTSSNDWFSIVMLVFRGALRACYVTAWFLFCYLMKQSSRIKCVKGLYIMVFDTDSNWLPLPLAGRLDRLRQAPIYREMNVAMAMAQNDQI